MYTQRRDQRNANIIYVADSGNYRIALMDILQTPVVVTTYAGSLTGQAGWRDDIGTAALFHEPFSIVMTRDGTMYVEDRENSLIRQITPTGQVTTLVGQGCGSGRARRPVVQWLWDGPHPCPPSPTPGPGG